MNAPPISHHFKCAVDGAPQFPGLLTYLETMLALNSNLNWIPGEILASTI